MLQFQPNDYLFPGVNWLVELFLLFFLLLFLWVCVCVRAIRYYWKFPMPAVMGNVIAAGPYRTRVQPPKMILDAIGAKPGMSVVEIGCGAGLYTIEVAKALQPTGMVFAVDIQQGMLDKLAARMEHENVTNIVPILADAEGQIPLEDKIADAVFSVTVLPEIPNPVKALLQIKRIMKDHAIFADAELLMDPDYPLPRTVISWAQMAGFTRIRQSGSHFRYVLVFKKENRTSSA